VAAVVAVVEKAPQTLLAVLVVLAVLMLHACLQPAI
jgi:hypothetical protein